MSSTRLSELSQFARTPDSQPHPCDLIELVHQCVMLYRETDPEQGNAHCGGCGTACSKGTLCSAGKCEVLCPNGQSNCAGQGCPCVGPGNECVYNLANPGGQRGSSVLAGRGARTALGERSGWSPGKERGAERGSEPQPVLFEQQA